MIIPAQVHDGSGRKKMPAGIAAGEVEKGSFSFSWRGESS